MSTSEDYAARQLDGVKDKCLAAIKTMRQFCDEAERDVQRQNSTPEDAIELTLRRFAWGFANASSSLCSAVSNLKEARKIHVASE